MPDPIEYWPAGKPPQEVAKSPLAVEVPAEPASVVPMEFDALLTETRDHGAVQAIRLALETMGIEVYQSDDGAVVDRQLRLFVRDVDAARANPAAAEVFARREKFKSFPTHPVVPSSTAASIVIDPFDL